MSTSLNQKQIQTPSGILVRCLGGPLNGQYIRVPSLDESFMIHPEDNFGKAGNMARSLRQKHRYDLKNRVTLGGVPTYYYAGVVI